jgi:predicted nucleic acid-binding protein
MIVLDINVISELMRPLPHPAVVAWVGAQPRATLYATGINEAELFYGISALPAGGLRRVSALRPANCQRCHPVAELRFQAYRRLTESAAGPCEP